jgi:single-stranded-DNA-specific exonuclease
MLSEELKLHPVLARMLAARGITDIEEAKTFLHGEKDHFHDPFLLDGMHCAVSRIREALHSGQLIRVYGDYDADGVSSTALMTYLLRRLDARFDTYIPHRVKEGYGLNVKAIDLAKQSGVSLIITVDTGISAREQVAYAASLGIDIVVTDHHEPPELLPEAVAVVNPKKPGCPYPFKQLAGVGVAFKLAHALLGEPPLDLLEIAAIGTVADLMPLIGENRLIVKRGLARMQRSDFIGIQALLAVSGISSKEVTATHLGFSLAPRINASGRLEHAGDAVELLTTSDKERAEMIAASLDELNKERQRIVEELTEQALHTMREEDPESQHSVIVVAGEDWNVGVIGIVAAKLLERFYRPTIVLSIDPATGLAKGSARSIPGYDLHHALTCCAELLDHYGGHQAAAGMTVHRDRLDAFRSRLNELADEWLCEEQLVPVYQADAELGLGEVTVDFIRQIETLAPFGMSNPAPRFVLSDLHVTDRRALGRDGQHMKLALAAEAGLPAAASVEAIGFGRGSLLQHISATAKVDVLGELSINEWNGVRKAQIVIHDIRVPHVQVFDWRGSKQPIEQLAAASSGDGQGGAGRAVAIVVEAESPSKLLDPDRISCGLWAYAGGSGSGIVPLNAQARSEQFAEAEDVLLLSLPDRLDSLNGMLGRCGANRIYAAFADWDSDYAKLPSRDAFKQLYQVVVHRQSWTYGDVSFLKPLGRKLGLSESLIRFMLDVFTELDFILREGDMLRAAASPRKRDLSESRAYAGRLARSDVEQALVYTNSQQLTEWITSRLAAQPNRILEGTG